MTFDDLFALLIVLIFIGLPLLNRLRGGGQQRPGGPPGAPGRPVDPRTQRPGGPMAGGQGEAAPERREAGPRDEDPMDELSRRLEEARRRVREAMGEQPEVGSDRPLISEPPRSQTIGGTGTPARTVSGAPAGGPGRAPTAPPRQAAPARSPQPPRAPRTGGGRPPLESVKRTGRRPPGLAQPTPPLEVARPAAPRAAIGEERGARRARARREAAELVATDSESVRKGLLWYMILGQPAAFGRGRMRSPRPSR